MNLVYKTSDMTRAREIVNVLLDQGIEASIQGKHLFGINKHISGGSLTVWVHDNQKFESAKKVLSDYYKSEEPLDKGAKKINPMSISAIVFFVIAWIAITIIVVIRIA